MSTYTLTEDEAEELVDINDSIAIRALSGGSSYKLVTVDFRLLLLLR
jgi:hypothetical protein